SLQDIDLYEIHEAFASTVLAHMAAWESEQFCRTRLGRDGALGAIDRSRLNVAGSSLAAGHPFAATGGRIVASLAKALDARCRETGQLQRRLISVSPAAGQGTVARTESVRLRSRPTRPEAPEDRSLYPRPRLRARPPSRQAD